MTHLTLFLTRLSPLRCGLKTLSVTPQRSFANKGPVEFEPKKQNDDGDNFDFPSESNSNFPSFTTIGKNAKDFSGFTKSPDFNMVSCVILKGQTNDTLKPPFPESDPEVVKDGAMSAVENITDVLASGDTDAIDGLAGLLSRDCLDRVKLILKDDERFQQDSIRRMVKLDRGDVFLSWIHQPQLHVGTGKHRMRFMTMSFPRYSEVAQLLQDNQSRQQAFVDEFKRQAQNKDTLGREDVKEAMAKIQASMFNPQQHMNDNEIICCNFDFIQDDYNSWMLNGIAMRKLKDCIGLPFYYRWKGRLNFSLKIRNKTFMQFLRFDYITDWLAILCVIAFLIPI